MSILEKIFSSKKLFQYFVLVVVTLFLVNLILTVILLTKVTTLRGAVDTYQSKESQMLNQIYGRTWTIQGALETKNNN
ncbi:TPA: hypothetical protein DF272_03560 [Candidatus Falkowbacteria bacterium]|nr:hypothetical protein [Candidatus Falkowbacteria bacterium]